MSAFTPSSADQLYGLLPEVYRDRDRRQDPAAPPLRAFVDAAGGLLDLVRATLEQRYADSFPDTTIDGQRCQEWLIPYFAELFAVRLRSPFPDGQRDEVASAVRWAQSKGTLLAAEEIVEAITQVEGELQEGFRLVAATARIGLPPAAVTPDLRRASRAVATDADDPEGQLTRFGWNGRVWPADDRSSAAPESRRAPYTAWKQANADGTPCFPGSYEDVSRRTVDLRRPGASRGLAHPKRLVVHIPPPWGFFTPRPVSFAWSDVLAALDPLTGKLAAPAGDYIERIATPNGVAWRNRTGDSVEITGLADLAGTGETRFEKIRFAGSVRLGTGNSAFHRCAIAQIDAAAGEPAGATLTLRDSLVGAVNAPKRVVFAEYATVLGHAGVGRLLASDCIFAGPVTTPPLSQGDCARFSRVPESWLASQPPAARRNGVSTVAPRFLSSVFGEPGCAVLSQDCADEIAFGAEDGGEMGCGHAWRHAANLKALAEKLAEYLPVGIEPAIIHDGRLLCSPPVRV